jgi:hypothetical protein
VEAEAVRVAGRTIVGVFSSSVVDGTTAP